MTRYAKKLIEKMLSTVIEENASDLHISVDNPPTLRVAGILRTIPNIGKITTEQSEDITDCLMSAEQKAKFLEDKEIDFSYTFNGNNRFRVNVFMQRGSISCSFRVVPLKIKSIEELNLPPILTNFTKANQGLVLVTGSSSQGKSTTLASMIDRINKNYFKKIITIEDPVEYIFEDDKAIIDQREIYYDTHSFRNALRSVFRQDPDVIMVGEMRDLETISATITAAETGHLVFSTLHTNSASESVHRIIDSFPAEQQNQVKSQLATSLLGIVSQRLLPRRKGGLIPACEVMISNSASANIIREGKVHELDLVIGTSANEGMLSLNQSLIELVKKGEVSAYDAIIYSRWPNELRKLLHTV